jgi:hypothetical protein
VIKRRPQRLDIIFSRNPVYFVTFCTRNRQAIPDLQQAQAALEAEESFGSQPFLITSCEPKKAIPKNGNMFVRIQFEQVWLKKLRIGRIKANLF